MNYYEQIQQAIDYIEDHIERRIELEQVASASCMSLASLYRLFFSLTGCTVKDYIRLRRIHLACQRLEHREQTILEIALLYGFQSHEAFSRAFKKAVGCNPSEYKQQHSRFQFEAVKLLDAYFGKQDTAMAEAYPEIKVLQRLEPMRVAACRTFSDSPEIIAINRLVQFAYAQNWQGYRIFGYDVSDSSQSMYGYEACITIPDHVKVDGDGIYPKVLDGGLYAVTCVKVQDIKRAWSRLMDWLAISPYRLGSHQWLEEHIEGVDDNLLYNVQLLMPIERK